MNTLDLAGHGPVIPVIVIDRVEDAVPLARALVAGGVKVLEVTLRTPAALDCIKAMIAEVPEAIVGAGTVRSIADAQAAKDAGCQFAVSPGYTPEIGRACLDIGLPLLPGVSTASEVMMASADGYRFLKLFPATAVGGLAMLKGLAGPLAGLKLCPTGGIDEESAHEFLAQPNVVCIGGSWMVPKAWVEAGDWERVEACAVKAAAIVAGARAR